MKNKRGLIVIIVIIILGIIFAFLKVRNSYMFNEDGTLSDGHKELIEHLRSIEDDEKRKNQIDFCIESNIITQKEADKLY